MEVIWMEQLEVEKSNLLLVIGSFNQMNQKEEAPFASEIKPTYG